MTDKYTLIARDIYDRRLDEEERIDMIASALRQVAQEKERETLERAAKVCDFYIEDVTNEGVRECARNIRSLTLQCVWNEINADIKPGPLQGNGCDETAQRNGLILASNIIAKHLSPTHTEEEEMPVKPYVELLRARINELEENARLWFLEAAEQNKKDAKPQE